MKGGDVRRRGKEEGGNRLGVRNGMEALEGHMKEGQGE